MGLLHLGFLPKLFAQLTPKHFQLSLAPLGVCYE